MHFPLIYVLIYIPQFIKKKMQATRNKPRCKDDCDDHVFELKNNNGNTKLDAHINFCPKFRRDPHRPEKTIPEYNLDHRYFTHAFVLGTQMKTLRNNAQQQQMHFQTMIKDACEKNNQVIFPRPSQKNCYCSVCKEHFKNYFEHINTQTHRTKIDAAIYNTEIKRLADTFKTKWEGAHAKANQIINELARQNQIYHKSMVNQEDEEEENQGEEEEVIEDEKNNEGSEEADEENENAEEANEEENEESEEEERQQEQEKEKEIEQKIDEEKRPEEQQINDMEAERQQDSGNLLSQQKITTDHTTKQSISSQFFEKRTQLVVFLRKNKNGKYEVAKDIEKYLVQKNTGSSEQKQIPNVNSKIPPTDRELRSREERKKSTDVGKKPRQVFKIKNPEKQASSQYKGNSSSYEYNQQEGICEILKDREMTDRIRTRNQCKQEKIDKNFLQPKPEKHEKKQKQKSKQPQEHIAFKANMHQHPPYPFYNPAMHPYANLEKGQMPGGKTMMGNPKMPQIPPFPMYLPPTQANPAMLKSPSNGSRIGPPTGYMPHPSMMMNPPPYFGYGMPPRPQNASGGQKPANNNSGNNAGSTNNTGEKKDRPQPYPMYYPNAWNPYMMNPHSMMRPPEGNSQQPQQPAMNMPPRQPMVYPPNAYHMMQPPPSSSTNSTKPGAQNPASGMGPSPNMYMQYPMDPRYYMGFPPPANGYGGKKPQQGPSSGPPPPPRDSR